MRKRLSYALGAGALALFMSSCFVLQSFTVLDYTLTVGQSTKAQFTLRPSDQTAGPNYRQFVLVGRSSSDISALTAKWGTNGTFGGPFVMPSNASLPTAIGSDCASNGIDYASITGMTWKGYITPLIVRDRAMVEQKALVQVGIKATASATPGNLYTIIGISGAWIDDGDDIPENNADDIFFCNGIGTSAVYIKT
jgi:hypothetical protein